MIRGEGLFNVENLRPKQLRGASYLAPSIFPAYAAMTEAVGKELNIPSSLTQPANYLGLRHGHELIFICSRPYVRGLVPGIPVAAPVPIGPRYEGRPVYFSDIIVQGDSPIQKLEHLKGHSLALNEEPSHSGYGVVLYGLAKNGLTRDFFGSILLSGSHQNSIDKVVKREVDAAVIDSQVLAVAHLNDPSLNESIKVVGTFGPSTIQPIMVSTSIPEHIREEIRAVLTSLPNTDEMREIFTRGMIDKIVRVEPSTYDDIRNMYAYCESVGLTNLIRNKKNNLS